MIGRDLVVALPASGDAHVEKRGQATFRDLHDVLQPGGVGRRVEAGRLVGIGHAEEQAGTFAMEVEAGREVDREWETIRKAGRRSREAHFAEVRRDGQLDSDRARDLR